MKQVTDNLQILNLHIKISRVQQWLPVPSCEGIKKELKIQTSVFTEDCTFYDSVYY